MKLPSALPILMTAATLASSAHATLDPALSNSKNRCPTHLNCSATKISDKIQAAECAHNTRTSSKQTFAVFTTNHAYDSAHGAPYGSCAAYTCTAPLTPSQMKDEDGCWTFFWVEGRGKSQGVGTGCIRDPQTGDCGCEDSDGTFVAGSSSCT